MAKSILITGCSSGIGYRAAHCLKARGYRVFATVRKEEDQQRLQNEGLDCRLLDVTSDAQIKETLESILEETGGTLDALFNNAGYGQPGAVEDLNRSILHKQFDTNLFGPMELTHHVLKVMRKQGHGRVIFNSSVLGLITLPFRGAYNASKFAMEGLVSTLRLELHHSGIDVSLIEPGPITSRFRANALKQFEQNIDIEGSYHHPLYKGVLTRLKKEGPAAPFTLPEEAVVQKLIHALESSSPKAHYYVTFPTWLFAILRRLLPVSALDAVLRRVSSDENK